MVQILPPRGPTKMDEFLAGLQGGVNRGLQFGEQILGKGIESKMQKKAIAEKLGMLGSQEYSDLFKNLDPRLAQISKMAASGLIEPGVATSMAEMIRQSQSDQAFNKAMGIGTESAESLLGNEGISTGQATPSEPETTPTASIKKPKIDYEGQISQLQNALQFASTPQKRAQVESKIRELQNQRDMQFKQDTAQKKDVRASYGENQTFIDKSHDQFEDSLRRESILERMDQLNESGELSDSGVINLLETLGFNQEWLKNPANEEYTKLALDLLGGGTLQADYGSRVLQSEFKVSQQRIPTLMQTPEGRRQISENIRTMLLPAKLKEERTQYYLDKADRTGEPLPHDLRGKVLKDIKPQLEEAYDKFKQRNGRYKVRIGTEPDDSAIEKYFYLANGNEDSALKMMKEDGYDIGSE